MAQFHHCITTDNTTQANRNPCLYPSTDPYSLYASSARLSRYGMSNEAYSHYAHGISGQSSPLFDGNIWYPQSHFHQIKGQGYEAASFPPVSMTSQQLNFGGVSTSLTAFQMATDFAGLMDASDPVKCPKPVHPFYWRKRGNCVPTEGMTRTKDKYRVVYTEKQRIGLEKAFKDNKFITMKEKTVLSKELDLSERQIKIWFQNRRAKERRQRRKAEVEQDHVMNEEQENESPDSPRSDDISNYPTVSPDVTHFSPLNYADGQLFGETTTKSQCRYQQNIPGVSCTSPVFYQRQSDSCSTSPSDWSQKGVSLTKYDVSPFAANPDWTLVYRS